MESAIAETRCTRSLRPGCPDVTDQLGGTGTSIQPLLVVRDAAAAINFYTSVFGATEVWRLMHYHRIGHAVLRMGTSEFPILDEFPQTGITGPQTSATDL